MDNTRDVRRAPSRFSPAKRHFHKQSLFSSSVLDPGDGANLASEKSRKERFQKLSLVGSRPNSSLEETTEMGSDKDEELISVAAGKRFRLPPKFLDDCNSVDHASVPRKLRSAMKKRSTDSASPPTLDGKKLKHSLRGPEHESPKKDVVKKTKKRKRLEWSPKPNFCGPITKDEEEVVETLYALAEMFTNNGPITNSRSMEDSSQDEPSTAPGAMERPDHEGTKEEFKLSVPSTPNNGERSDEETTKASNNMGEPRDLQQPDLVDSRKFCKEVDNYVDVNLESTPLQSRGEQNNEKLHDSCNFGLPLRLNLDCGLKQPREMDKLLSQRKQENGEASVSKYQLEQQNITEDRQHNGPVLWPGLLTASHNNCSPLQSSIGKIPSWCDASVCPSKPVSTETCNSNKVGKTIMYKAYRKRCAVHVYISHLIQTLQNPERKDLSLPQPSQPGGHEEANQRICPGARFNVFQNVQHGAFPGKLGSNVQTSSSEALSGIRHQNRHQHGHNVGSPVPQISPSQKKSFDFLSLSAGGGGLNHNGSASASRAGGEKGLGLMSQFHVPYLHSLAQQHIPVTLSAPKTHYSHAYPDQLSAVASQQVQQLQLQLPSYLGNSGRSSLHKDPTMITKEHQQQVFWTSPIASVQYKPTGNLKVAQFPSWQSGRVESPAVIPFPTVVPPPSTLEVLNGPKHEIMSRHNHHYHHHQQQQFSSLRSPTVSTLGKRQDHLIHPSVHDETTMRFHRGNPLSLQLLCNERL